MTNTTTSSAPGRPFTGGWAGRRWWGLAVVTAAQMMVTLDTTIVAIALPSAQRAVGLTGADRQWVITAYTLAFGGLLLLGGRLGDVIGRRRALLLGVVGFAAASAVGGAATSPGLLIGARAGQGVFAALIAPATLALLTTTFTDPRQRARAFGVYSAGLMSGGAVGLILGGALTDYLDWRWCLYVNIPIAAAVVIGAVAVLPNVPANRGTRLDLPGAILGCAGMFVLVSALAAAGTRGWGSALVLGLLVAAVLLLTAFVLVQSRVTHPLLPLRLLADRNRAGAFLAMSVCAFGMLGMFLFMTFHLQAVLRYPAILAGLAFLPYVGTAALTATQITSRLMPYLRPRILVSVGLSLAATGLLLLTRLTPGSSYPTQILPALVLFGLGVGSIAAPIMSTATSVDDPAHAGIAAAFVNTSQQIGGSIGTALLNTIAAGAASTYLAARTPTPSSADEAAVYGAGVASAWSAGALLIAAVVAGLLMNGHSTHRPPNR